MDKVRIKLLFLGHPRHVINKNKLSSFSSKFFEISSVESIENLPKANKNDGYLDVEYSVEEVSNIITKTKNADLTFAVMNYPYDDNFYLHRINDNAVCLSIAGIDQLLLNNNISIENFILKNIYEVSVLFNILPSVCSNEAYDIVHDDTRGCLFDMNGDKFDVIYNTEKPLLCNSCKSYINSKSLPDGYISKLEKDLKKIKKPLISRVELFIKKYPLFSVGFTLISSFIINILASLFLEYSKLNIAFTDLIKAMFNCLSGT